MRELEPDAPAYWVRGYERVIAEAVFGLRVVSRMFTVFGLIALFLAAAGNGFDPTEPLVYVLVLGVLALVALLAILVPARRALRIDPVIALRHE